MKQLLFLIACFSIVLFSCKTGPKPEEVAANFLNAMNKQEFDTARLYCTDSTLQLIDFLKGISEMAKQEGSSFADAPPVSDVKCTVNGDKAVCTFCCDGEGKNAEIDLVKVKGIWKANISFQMPEEAAFESMLDTTYTVNEAGDSNEVIEDVEEEDVKP